LGLCDDAGIIPYCTDNPPSSLDDHTPDILLDAIRAAIPQQELKKFTARTASGMAARVRGGRMANKTAYGYHARFDGEGRQVYVVDDAEAATVRAIFAMFLDGHGGKYIARELFLRGTPSPAGGSWTPEKVYGIFKLAYRYAGYAELNVLSKTGRPYIRARGTWEPIIAEDTLQHFLAERAARAGNRRIADTPHLLTGVCWCEVCGQVMGVNRIPRHPSVTQEYVVCKRHIPNNIIRSGVVRRALVAMLEQLGAMADADLDALLQADDQPDDDSAARLAAQRRMLTKLDDDERRADDAYVDGNLDAAGYTRQKARLKGKRAQVQAEIAQLEIAQAAQAQRGSRKVRLREVAGDGLAMLEGDTTEANAWLRQHLRIWIADKRIARVEFL
jgi:hypothetical protein